MTWLTIAALFLLVMSSLNLSYGQDTLSVKIRNPDGAHTGDTLNLVYGQVEIVICEVTNSVNNPEVTFGFVNSSAFPEATNVTTTSRFTDDKYSVNVTLTIKVTGKMNREYLVCSFDNREWKAYIDLFFPPLLLVSGTGMTANAKDNTMTGYCESISVPETNIVWTIDGVPLNETHFQNTVDQGCKQVMNSNYESISYKFRCRNNLTLFNLSKEDIGSNLTCSYIYGGATSYVIDVTTLDYLYKPENVTVVAKPTKAVDGSSNGTIELTCISAAANPEPKLRWFRGSREMLANLINTSQYPVGVSEAMYNGRVVSQTIVLSVNKELNDETYLCCADMWWIFKDNVCESTDLQVPWLLEILAPQMPEYTFYVGSNISIPCIVDSNPVASLSWHNAYGQTLNDGNKETNFLELNLTDIKKDVAGKYECKANLYVEGLADVLREVSKIITINVVDTPTKPQLTVSGSNIYIETASKASEVPQSFYIQYKKSSDSLWLEISEAFSDTLPGQGSRSHDFGMKKLGLQPGEYQVRIKALSQTGLIFYTDSETFQVNEKDESEMVAKSDFNTAIVVSVLVTAAVFIIIIVAVVCLVKRGVCSSSDGSNSWDVR